MTRDEWLMMLATEPLIIRAAAPGGASMMVFRVWNRLGDDGVPGLEAPRSLADQFLAHRGVGGLMQRQGDVRNAIYTAGNFKTNLRNLRQRHSRRSRWVSGRRFGVLANLRSNLRNLRRTCGQTCETCANLRAFAQVNGHNAGFAGFAG